MRDTTLTYQEVGPAHQSRLTRVDSCDALGNCQEPVQFGWLSNWIGWLHRRPRSPSPMTPVSRGDNQCRYLLPVSALARSERRRPARLRLHRCRRPHNHQVCLSSPTGYQAADVDDAYQLHRFVPVMGRYQSRRPGRSRGDECTERGREGIAVDRERLDEPDLDRAHEARQHDVRRQSYSVLSYYTKLAEMDGDGRLDLVAFERFQTQVLERHRPGWRGSLRRLRAQEHRHGLRGGIEVGLGDHGSGVARHERRRALAI